MMLRRKPYAAPETDVLLPRHEEVMELAIISTEWNDATEADAKEYNLSFDDEDEEFGWVEWTSNSVWEE